jgi:FkbM family methyltransferase
MYDRRALFAKAGWRLVLWRLISALGHGGVHRLPGLRFKMYLEPRFRSVGSLALFAIGARYEPGLMALPKLLRRGDVVLDCGANQGAYSLCAAEAVGAAGRVVAVEPQPYAVRALAQSLAANSFDNVTVVEAAVSQESGVAPFHFNDVAVAASLVNKAGSVSHDVQVWSIDALMRREGLAQLDLIKLDVEGSEAAALRGAAATLARCKPLVLFECWDPQEANSREAWEVLADNGYRFFDIDGEGRFAPISQCVRSPGLLAATVERLGRLQA